MRKVTEHLYAQPQFDDQLRGRGSLRLHPPPSTSAFPFAKPSRQAIARGTAMDPVSLVGITAAAVQFAGVTGKGLLKGIGLLRGLADTPARLSKLLGDIEKSTARIIRLLATLNDDQSDLVKLLSTKQLKALKDTVNDALSAATELQSALEPLFGTHSHSERGFRAGAKKMWRDVVSVKAERSIGEKLDNVCRMNEEVLRELQLAGIDLNTSTLQVTPCLANLLFGHRLT